MNELIDKIKCYSIYGVINAKEKFERDLFTHEDGYVKQCLIVGKDKCIFVYRCTNKFTNPSKTCYNHNIPNELYKDNCNYCKIVTHSFFNNYIGVPVGKFSYSSFFRYDKRLVVVQNYKIHTFELITLKNNYITTPFNAYNITTKEITYLMWLRNYHHILALHRYYKRYLLPELINYIIYMFI